MSLLAGETQQGREELEILESDFGTIDAHRSRSAPSSTTASCAPTSPITSGSDSITLWYALDEAGGIAAVEGPTEPPTAAVRRRPAAASGPTTRPAATPDVTVEFERGRMTVASPRRARRSPSWQPDRQRTRNARHAHPAPRRRSPILPRSSRSACATSRTRSTSPARAPRPRTCSERPTSTSPASTSACPTATVSTSSAGSPIDPELRRPAPGAGADRARCRRRSGRRPRRRCRRLPRQAVRLHRAASPACAPSDGAATTAGSIAARRRPVARPRRRTGRGDRVSSSTHRTRVLAAALLHAPPG